MKKVLSIGLIVGILFTSCNRNKMDYDASGVFETTEVIISSQVSGQIEAFDLTEGEILETDQQVGYIDSTQLYLQKLQLLSGRSALLISRPDVGKQIQAIREQIANSKREKTRIENLLKGDAATQKQLDDINSQIKVLEGTLSAQTSTLNNNIGNLNEQSSTLEIQVAQIEDQLKKCRIINPVKGTVLSKYAQAKEIATPGKPLYKIADIDNMFLRAYITASQLTQVKIGQSVKVYADFGENDKKEYSGTISWISDKSEFTPKSIQTKDERASLVYAVKIAVKNDGYIKKGMYGDVSL